MKKLFKDFLNFFRGKTTYIPNDGSMKMHIMTDHSDRDVQSMLGITEKRGDELVKILFDQIKKDEKTEDRSCMSSLVEISEKCSHPNELGFIAFLAGKTCERIHCSQNPIAMLLGLAGRNRE